MEENIIRLIVVGDSAVGKTAAILKYVDNISAASTSQTIGVDFKKKNIIIGNQDVCIQIWDTAGQERYRTLTVSYFRKAQGIAVFFDLTHRDSFNHVQMWMKSIEENVNGATIPIVIFGNKSDLADTVPDPVKPEEVDEINPNRYPYFETSAKTGEGVHEAFTALAKSVFERKCAINAVEEQKTQAIVDISKNKKKKKCCS